MAEKTPIGTGLIGYEGGVYNGSCKVKFIKL